MILITGCTGRIGKILVKQLHGFKLPMVGLTRDKDRAQKRLRGLNIDLKEANLDDINSLEPVLHNIDMVFLLTPASPTKCQQELNMIAACQKQGITKIVKISSLSAQIKAKSLSQACRDHYHAEQMLRDSSIKYTILRPTAFTQQLIGELIGPMLRAGNSFSLPLGEQKINFIDINDIASTVATCLSKNRYENKIFELTGFDTINMDELAAIFSQCLGRSIQYHTISMNAFVEYLQLKGVPDFLVNHTREIYTCLKKGDTAFFTDTVQMITGNPPLSVTSYIDDNLALFNQEHPESQQRVA